METRRMRAEEWRIFKLLRLAALKRDGDQFGQSHEVVSGYSDEKWREDSKKAAQSNEFFIVLAFDGPEPVGMSGCIRTEGFGKIIAVWVKPSHRGGGIGGLLVKATMETAGLDQYKLTVVEDNHPAIRTYEKLGFVRTGFSYENHKGFREIEMVREPSESPSELVDWLMSEGGPIIRWRVVRDLGYRLPEAEKAEFLREVLATGEVRRWLDNLGKGPIHHSKDTAAENALAKIVEYGLHAGIPELDAKALPYAEKVGENGPWWQSMVIAAFLIAAGYHGHPAVRIWFLNRLDALHATAVRGSYDLYLSPGETSHIPKAWRGKPIYRPEFTADLGNFTLPTCYDLYALAHWPCLSLGEAKKVATVITYLSHPAFQSTVGGYIWSPKARRCHAAGRAFLACLTPERTVLFLELTARFPEARDTTWFRKALSDLERHRTEGGRYSLPGKCLKEERDSYYLYQGAHMGLGENRRSRSWREIESTFRVLNVRRLMKK